jgi:hypothetical protein
MSDDYRKHNMHPGFRYGLIGGIGIGVLFFLQIFLRNNYFDLILIILSMPILFLIGRFAGVAKYKDQEDILKLKESIQSTGFGAGLTAIVIIWMFIIFRGMLRDFLGENILMEPLSLCMNFVLSAGGATIMGILGAKSVINQFITQD